jgi:hypothetical protein
MTWSIWRGLSLSVPLRCDSFPINRSTSGSGAASRTHIVPDAEQHRFWRTPFLNDEGPALFLHPTQQLAKIGAGAKRGDNDGVMLVGSQHLATLQFANPNSTVE